LLERNIDVGSFSDVVSSGVPIDKYVVENVFVI
jgi:hypothetical protein